MNRTGLLAAIVLPAIAALGVLLFRADSQRREALARVAQLESELAKRGVASPPLVPDQASKSADAPNKDSASSKPAAPSSPATAGPPSAALIEELRVRRQALEEELRDVRAEAARSAERAEALQEDVKRIEQQLSGANEQARRDASNAEALAAELKVKTQRMEAAEQSVKSLQDRVTKAERAAQRVQGASKELDDLIRRREASIVALERRYREVTDLYRAFSLNLQTRENGNQPTQAGDISRIQAALQQAEEELRQLRSLNARAAELARAK